MDEKKIEEVMELSDYVITLGIVVGIDIATGNEAMEKSDRELMQVASKNLETKLRQLLGEQHG